MLFTDGPQRGSRCLGVLVILAATLGVVWILHSTRKRHSTIPPDHSLLDCARVELQRVEMADPFAPERYGLVHKRH